MSVRACAGLAGALLGSLLGTPASGADAAHGIDRQTSDALAHDILRQLIEINTTDSAGSVTAAAAALAQRLRTAGFAPADLAVLGPSDRKHNLVVRLRGTGRKKPVLFLGHLDVVEARREDWSTDPFRLLEKDGYFWGRGTIDMKSADAIMAAALIRLQHERFRPTRDVIVAFTADEEGGCCNGVQWLLENHRALIDAEFVLNQDDYSVVLEHGRPLLFRLDASEKIYADYQLTVTNPGGHSSQPVPDNAIYRLTHGLDRLATYEFPFELNDVTREYYRRKAGIETGARATDMRAMLASTADPAAIARLSQDALDNAALRTTCVATRLAAGHANNALPQRAEAVVNCRILPGHSPREIQQVLASVLADPAIAVHYLASDGTVREQAPERRGFAPTLLPEVLTPLEQVVERMWPHLSVIPYMTPGGSDAEHTIAVGLPTYTFSGIAVDPDDDREHGRDERVGVDSFYQANEFFYRFLKALTAH